MKYLNSTPFSSKPATNDYRKNYPFGPSKFERELAEEKKKRQIEDALNEAEDAEVNRHPQ